MSELKSQFDKVVYISLTNGAGGAEQILLMAAKYTGSPMIFLKQEIDFPLKLSPGSQTIKFLTRHSIFLGFLLLIPALNSYRKNSILVSSHPYLNGYLGILKRIGFLRSKLVTRESTSVFLRYSGVKKLSYKLVYMLGYPAVDLLICQTEEMKAQLLNNFTFLSDKNVSVLDNPIDFELVKQQSEADLKVRILSDNYICAAGRLLKIKGFDQLIRAFSKIAAQVPELKLVILGEGDERGNLQQIIDDLNLQMRVILPGFVSNPFPYFKNARLCVVSSIREGFPNVLLQMMALNSCVVSTLCADGIESFETISTVPVNNVDALADGMIAKLACDHNSNENPNYKYIITRTPQNFVHSILNKLT